MALVFQATDLFRNSMSAIGLGSPIVRGLVFAGLGFIAEEYFKPTIAYVKQGEAYYAKAFSLTDNGNATEGTTTLFPWWSIPLLAGLVGALFL